MMKSIYTDAVIINFCGTVLSTVLSRNSLTKTVVEPRLNSG